MMSRLRDCECKKPGVLHEEGDMGWNAWIQDGDNVSKMGHHLSQVAIRLVGPIVKSSEFNKGIELLVKTRVTFHLTSD